MLGLYVYTDKGFYLSFEYSVCKLVKIVLKIMWTACMKIWVLWKAAFYRIRSFPTLGIAEIWFSGNFLLKSKQLFSCTNIIPALIMNYTRNGEVTLKYLKVEPFQ